MQQIILPQAIRDLIPNRDIITDNNQNFSAVRPFIHAVLKHLQDTHQNLSTVDFVNLIRAELAISNSTFYYTNTSHAIYCEVTLPVFKPSSTDGGVYSIIIDWLNKNQASLECYHHNINVLTADYPMKSTLNPTKIAVWRNTSKMGNWDKRQAVSVRKWIGSTLQGLTDEQAESLAKAIDKAIAPPQELDIRHHNSYDFDGWERAYVNNAIRSCMNPDHTSCEVGIERTFTTYCSGYHGLPDNGLNLTVLYQDDKPVARAITFADGEQNYYIKTYGDDRLKKWLDENGYEQSDFKAGTILYTDERLMKPYVDGDDVHYADHLINSDGKHYWVLETEGEYNLQTTDAFAYPQSTCECCNGRFSDDALSEHQSAVNGDWYMVCEDCYFENRYWVYNGRRYSEPVFFHDGYHPATHDDYVEYDGEYYEVDSLSEYDLRLIDGTVYHIDDLYYCEFECEYFTRDEVYTDADEISTTQPVYFPYDCVRKEYWGANVVECACGTLAVENATAILGTPSLGDVVTLDAYWIIYRRYNGAGVEIVGIIFNIDAIESDYDWYEAEQMQAFLEYAQAYNAIQYLRFQELGI